MCAVELNQLNVYKSLAGKEGIDFNMKDNEGKTILHYAVHNKNEEFLKTILNNDKVDVNIQMDRFISPLHYAIQNKNGIFTTLLINNGKTNINIRDGENLTPLMHIIHSDRYERSSYLYYRSFLNENESFDSEKIAILYINNQRLDNNQKDKSI